MTAIEKSIVLQIAEREPGELLALLAGCLAPLVSAISPVAAVAPVVEQDRRPGDDPYLITEEEFSFRARFMSVEEQAVLRCRVNAARLNKKGMPDHARRQRQRADRLEQKLNAC